MTGWSSASIVPLIRITTCGVATLLATVAAPAGAQDQPPSLNPLATLRKEALKGFRERPLFAPTRTEPRTAEPPPAATPAEAPRPPDPPPNLRLIGIVSGDHNLALVRMAEGGGTTVLSTGDKVGDWSVTVLPAGLRLEADTRSVDIGLFAPRSGTSARDPAAGSNGATDAPAENPTP